MTKPWSISELCRPELAEVAAYQPVRGDFEVRLDANEAPALLSSEVRARLGEIAASTEWNRYPDAQQEELRRAIARDMDTSPDSILAGVGSDEVIALMMTALSRARDKSGPSVLTTTPTFVMYRMSARVRGMRVIEVPLDDAWDIAESSLLRALELAPPNLVFIASPNNPTGTVPNLERLKNVIARARESLVVIDEAYVEYAATDFRSLWQEFEHVVILRTLSKIGFASLRVGWLAARPELVRELDKVRQPYNLPSVSQRLACAVLGELRDEVRATVRQVVSERQRMFEALASMPRIEPTPSQANFIWFRTERPAREIFDALSRKKILVRSFHTRGGRLANQLRVTLGTPAENGAFLAALSEVA